MTIKEIIKELTDCQSQACNCNGGFVILLKGITKAIQELREIDKANNCYAALLWREECWSNNIRVNIPVPDESGVGLDNTWSIDKYYIENKLRNRFLDFDMVFVSCGEDREGAVTYNVDIEVSEHFDQSCTIEQNEMAIDHDLEEFCKFNNWLIIPKEEK